MFRALLENLPVSLVAREILRMCVLAEANTLKTPLLDVGCGDGFFWEALTCAPKTKTSNELKGLVGIDINKSELQLASLRLSPLGAEIFKFDIASDPMGIFEDRRDMFQTVIANCSLEHVPKLQQTLQNIKRLMAPEAELWLFVPAPNWSDTFVVKKFLYKLGPRVAGAYGGLWDGFYQHHHLYPAWVWSNLLQTIGFETSICGLGSKKGNHLAELWLPPAFISFIYKSLFGRYPRRFANLLKRFFLPWMRTFLEEVQRGDVIINDLEHPEIVEYTIRCKYRQGG